LKLLEYAWNTVTSIGRRDHETLKLVLEKDLTNPSLGSDSRGYVIRLPAPKIVKGGFYSLHGLYFDPDERGWAGLWRLFKASMYHSALHAAYSDFRAYAPWARGKDTRTATYAVSLVEDFRVTRKALKTWPGILPDIAHANFVSSRRVGDPDTIEDDSTRFATKLLLSLWGVFPTRKKNSAEDKEAKELAGSLATQIEGSTKAGKEAEQEILVDCAQLAYAPVASRRALKEIPFFPHTESHGACGVFDSKLVDGGDQKAQLASAFHAVGLGEPAAEEETSSMIEASEFYHDNLEAERRLSRIRDQYDELIATTRLDSIEFPSADYASYLRVKSALAGPIRNIRDQLRLVKNVSDETSPHESGQIDTQAAMQVIASGDTRTDVFTRDEIAAKNESWAILIDASKSTSSFSHEVKGITTCLAEVANQLVLARDQWALYTFNNSLQIIKEFGEDFGVENRARIGGIQQRNLTYLPDAIRVCYRVLAAKPVDVRILVVASDGYPAGYDGIEKSLVSTIKDVSKSGVLLMGVGIDSHALEEYFTVNCVIGSPYQMMKSFVKSYMELSSLF
jgi:hypothetical protein